MTLTEPTAPERRYYSVSEAAVYTGFSPHYVRDAARTGRLKGYRSKPGTRSGHWRFRTEDLDAWVQSAVIGPRPSARKSRGA